MVFRLCFLSGAQSGQVVPLDERRPITLGRSPSSTIQVHDGNVSRHHARLHVEGEKCLITDLESTNGTFVNGERVSEVEVPAGAICRIGLSNFRIEMVEDDDSTVDTDVLPPS